MFFPPLVMLIFIIVVVFLAYSLITQEKQPCLQDFERPQNFVSAALFQTRAIIYAIGKESKY